MASSAPVATATAPEPLRAATATAKPALAGARPAPARDADQVAAARNAPAPGRRSTVAAGAGLGRRAAARCSGAAPLEGQARCIEILQKASLEKITPAETEFFKRECK